MFPACVCPLLGEWVLLTLPNVPAVLYLQAPLGVLPPRTPAVLRERCDGGTGYTVCLRFAWLLEWPRQEGGVRSCLYPGT